MSQKRREIKLENVNLQAEVTPTSLRVWVCSRETGISVLRIKTLSGVDVLYPELPSIDDILIRKEKKKIDE